MDPRRWAHSIAVNHRHIWALNIVPSKVSSRELPAAKCFSDLRRGIGFDMDKYRSAEISRVAVSNGCKADNEVFSNLKSSAERHKSLRPNRHRAVVIASWCLMMQLNIKKVEFHLVPTSWMSLCSGRLSWYCTSFNFSVALTL